MHLIIYAYTCIVNSLQDRNLCRPRPHRADRLLRWRRWLTRGLETITDLNPSYPIGGSVLAAACVRTGRFSGAGRGKSFDASKNRERPPTEGVSGAFAKTGWRWHNRTKA